MNKDDNINLGKKRRQAKNHSHFAPPSLPSLLLFVKNIWSEGWQRATPGAPGSGSFRFLSASLVGLRDSREAVFISSLNRCSNQPQNGCNRPSKAQHYQEEGEEVQEASV